MCKYCVEYGNGTKWYLNPDNYKTDILYTDGHKNGFLNLTGSNRNTYEWSKTHNPEMDLSYGASANVALDTMFQHAGQVIPLEDALKIVDIAPGERFMLQHCGCRRYFGHGDFYGCLFFESSVDRNLSERPWETDSKVISREEAKAAIRERHKMGLVISIFDYGTSPLGKAPAYFCFCNESECAAAKARAYRGTTAIFNKGEYVAVIDTAKCREGCVGESKCLIKCQFGAIKYSPLKDIVTINSKNCFGCGVCRTACPKGAIKLVDRTTFPALVDEW